MHLKARQGACQGLALVYAHLEPVAGGSGHRGLNRSRSKVQQFSSALGQWVEHLLMKLVFSTQKHGLFDLLFLLYVCLVLIYIPTYI